MKKFAHSKVTPTLHFPEIFHGFSSDGPKATGTKDHLDKTPPSWFFSGDILSHLTVYSFIARGGEKMTKMTLFVAVVYCKSVIKVPFKNLS